MIVAGVLLGTVTSVAVPTLAWIAAQRRETERRQVALEEVTNLMEAFTARPWEDLTPEAAEELALSDDARRQLLDPELTATVQSSEDDPQARRVHIELSWKSRAGQRLAPVRLTAWVYPRSTSAAAVRSGRPGPSTINADAALHDAMGGSRSDRSALSRRDACSTEVNP